MHAVQTARALTIRSRFAVGSRRFGGVEHPVVEGLQMVDTKRADTELADGGEEDYGLLAKPDFMGSSKSSRSLTNSPSN